MFKGIFLSDGSALELSSIQDGRRDDAEFEIVGGDGSVRAKLLSADKLLDTVYLDKLAALVNMKALVSKRWLAVPTRVLFNVRHDVVGYLFRYSVGVPLGHLMRGLEYYAVTTPMANWHRPEIVLACLRLVSHVRAMMGMGVTPTGWNPWHWRVDSDCRVFYGGDVMAELNIPNADGTYLPASNGRVNEWSAPECSKMASKVQMTQQAAFSVAMFCFELLTGTSPFAWSDPTTGLSSSGDGLALLWDGKCPLIGTELRMPDQAFRAFSWLSWGVKRVFLRMFVDGYSHPEERPSLDDIVFALKAQLAVYEKDTRAERHAVIPTSVKDSEDFRI